MLVSQQGITLTVWMIVFTTLITLVVALRFWAIKVGKRALRTDDYLILVAYISTLVLEGFTWWGILEGLGAHTVQLSEYQLGVQSQILLGAGIPWLSATVFCKLSVLFLYLHIFPTKNFKIAAWILIGIVSSYGIVFACIFFAHCNPHIQGRNLVREGYCKSPVIHQIGSLIVNMVVDTAVVVLPMPPLWNLRMPLRKKLAVTSLFGLGFIIVAIMALRVAMTVDQATEPDFVYSTGRISFVVHLEVWLGIVVACMPTLAPLYSKYHGVIQSKIKGSSVKRPDKRQLKEAEHSIGGGGWQSFRRKNSNSLDKRSHYDLEECMNLGKAETTVGTASTSNDDEIRIRDANGIGVRHDIWVHGELKGG